MRNSSLTSRLILAALPLLAGAAATQAQKTTVVSDFEIMSNLNSQGGYWYFYDDRASQGESYITTADSAFQYPWDSATYVPGAGGSTQAVELGFVLGAKSPVCGATCTYPAQVGMGTDIVGGLDLDITGATAISFRARAKAPLKVVFTVGTSDVKDKGYYAKAVAVTTEWAKYTVPLTPGKDFAQPSWAAKQAFNPAHFISLGWMIGKADNAGLTQGAFDLDDVVIEGWEPAIVEEPSSLAPALPGARGHGFVRDGNRIRLDLDRVLGKSHASNGAYSPDGVRPARAGSLEALDARGRSLGRTGFGAHDREVEMDLKGQAQGAPVYLRVIPR